LRLNGAASINWKIGSGAGTLKQNVGRHQLNWLETISATYMAKSSSKKGAELSDRIASDKCSNAFYPTKAQHNDSTWCVMLLLRSFMLL
jgi:hypothetical protein